jgi:predicted nucleic acid-binding protein
VPNPLVVNASPIIVLAKAGLLDIMRILGDPILVPAAVVQEIQQASPNDPAVRALGQATWIQVINPGVVPGILQPFGLDPGEEAVLTWALANPGAEALLDDQAARRCANALGVPHRGCLGLVIVAKQQGIIKAARPVIENLRQVGLRLTNRIMNQALTMVGE